MKLTEKQMITILKNNLIETCTEEEKKQVYYFAFGEEFMKSKNKGRIEEYYE